MVREKNGRDNLVGDQVTHWLTNASFNDFTSHVTLHSSTYWPFAVRHMLPW